MIDLVYIDQDTSMTDAFVHLTSCDASISLQVFTTAEDGLSYLHSHAVHAVVVAPDLPGFPGLSLAERILGEHRHLHVILTAEDDRYAMPAWDLGLAGYLVKPFDVQALRTRLDRCSFPLFSGKKILVQTIPEFSVLVNGTPVHIAGTKTRELLALMVDSGIRGITAGEGVAYLWPDKPDDAKTRSLFRMTYKRLAEALEAVGAGSMIASQENRRYIRTELVDCDLYRILAGDHSAMARYSGEYMREYSWAEERNAQLYRLILAP